MRLKLQRAGIFDPHFFIPWLLILACGLLMLYSVTSPPAGYSTAEELRSTTVSRAFFERQVVWAGLGLAAMFLGAMIPFWIYKDYLAWILYGLGVALLVLLLILPPLRGETRRWLALGSLGIQPSEFFKVILVFMLASFLAARRGSINRIDQVLFTLLLVLPPALLVLKQPDLGTSLIYLWLMVPLLLWRGLDLRRLLLMVAPLLSGLIVLYGLTRGEEGLGIAHLVWGVFMVGLFLISLFYREMPVLERIVFYLSSIAVGLAVPRLWGSLLDYQRQRILVFFDPDLDRLGASYQIFQSKVAIGSGGLFGRGFLQGTQKSLAFLPARHTDFVFSVLGEEFGFVGALILLSLYAYLIWQGFKLAAKARHPFGQLISVGVSALLLFHVFVNVGMTVGLMPVTGLPLPGLSFGGSALIAVSFLLGVQMNISRNWGRY